MKALYNFFKIDEDTCLQSKMLSRGIANAQKAIEGRNFGIRKNVLQYDDVMNKQREVMYAERMKVLKGENVHDQVLKYIPDYVEEVVRTAVNADDMPELWSETELNAALEAKLLPEGTNYVTREKLEKWDYPLAIQKITAKTIKEYEKKIEEISAMGVDFSDVERRVLLMTVDRNWIDHIDAMDQLRKGIGLRAYGQVDPIISYKKEGFDMFDEMVERIQRTTISRAFESAYRTSHKRRRAVRPAQTSQPNSQNAQQSGECRVFRRQMPEPIQNMSSYKEAQARAAQAQRQNANNGENNGNN